VGKLKKKEKEPRQFSEPAPKTEGSHKSENRPTLPETILLLFPCFFSFCKMKYFFGNVGTDKIGGAPPAIICPRVLLLREIPHNIHGSKKGVVYVREII
jgi:hypothetical protein